MSKSQVLADIRAKIKTNGNQEITGDILQGVLTESVNLVPDNVSDLNNDANYQTEEEVNAKVADKADLNQFNELSSKVTNLTIDMSEKANQSDLANKVDKTGYTQDVAGNDFIVKSANSTELFKIGKYGDTNASQVSVSVSVKGVEIYPLDSSVEGWPTSSGFRAQVVNNADQPQLNFLGTEGTPVQLAVNSRDNGDDQAPMVLVRRGVSLCDYNDFSTGSAFMNGYGSFNILNTNGILEITSVNADPETGDPITGPFKSYSVLRILCSNPMPMEDSYGVQSTLQVSGDVVALTYDEETQEFKNYRLSQIGDIQTALQAILGN